MVVADGDAGERLDRFLTAKLDGVSRSLLKKHIDAGCVTVSGAAPTRGAGTRLRGGEVVVYVPPPAAPLELVAEDIPLTILFQDEHLVVVDKPRDLVVHPALGHPSGTLVNALLHHVTDFERGDDDLRPGIVHRLDRDTTGVMVVAKHRQAQATLSDAFRLRRVQKSYLAVVHGCPRPRSATIDTLFGRHPTDRKRFSSKVLDGKRAVTHYRVEQVFPGASQIHVDLETGRTHQIRVHLADRGHPLVGDPTYGRRRRCRDPGTGPAINAFPRPALHAARLSLDHPMTGAALTFEAPVPEDLQALMGTLAAIADSRSTT